MFCSYGYKKTMYLRVLFLFSIAIIQQNYGMEYKKNNQKHSELELFIQKYAPPKKLLKYIKENEEFLTEGDCFNQPIEIDGVIQYFRKDNDLRRVVNAIRMKNIINKYDLDCLGVPKKYVYKHMYEGKPKLMVLAEYVQSIKLSENEKLPLIAVREIKQFKTLVKKTGLWDYSISSNKYINIVRDIDNKLIFIDTEDRSFNTSYPHYQIPDCQLDALDEDASEWLSKEKEMLTDENVTLYNKNYTLFGTRDPVLPDITKYDNSSIDFQKAKLEWRINFNF